MEAGRKIRVQPRVIAEVAKSQMGQMHAKKIGARTARPRVFSRERAGRAGSPGRAPDGGDQSAGGSGSGTAR
jgi:hypothetical protein